MSSLHSSSTSMSVVGGLDDDDDDDDDNGPEPQAAFKGYVVETYYDPEKNKDYPPGKRSSTDQIYEYTEQERTKAKSATVAFNREQFTKLLKIQLRRGKKTKNSYLKLTSELLENEPMRINDKEGNMLLIVDPTMSQNAHEDMWTKFQTIFGPSLENTDSKALGKELVFPALHFTWYNRYSTQFSTPNGMTEEEGNQIYPPDYQRPGKKKGNISNLVPRASKELQCYSGIHDLLDISLEKVLMWQSNQFLQYLPKEYEKISQFANSLPGPPRLAAYPFCGFVVNLNNSTWAHWDWNDEELCIVIVVGDCEDGYLVIVELGLVLALQNGDMVIFRSSKLTHFNLHFKGRRASMVFHSDGAGRAWVKDSNGWQLNMYFVKK